MREAIKRVIDDLERLKIDDNGYEGDLFDSGFECGLNAAQERLREVLKAHDHQSNGQTSASSTHDTAEQV